MARFFIDRPVFAWVAALFICRGGALAIPNLPVARYPVIAPPSIVLSTACPGASVESLYTGTTRLIEDELNGAASILSFESTTDSFGSVTITATFQAGTDPALASVEVQNRLERVPPVDNLGNAAGFSFRLQDRANRGYTALTSAEAQSMALAKQSPVLRKVKIEGLPATPQVELIIDREKAAALGVALDDINDTIKVNLGSIYTNDFPNRGKMQRVYVQAEQLQRLNASDIMNYVVKNSSGTMVPLSSFANLRWGMGPRKFIAFNGYQSVRFTGEPNLGYTSGDAITEMERLMLRMPKGFGHAWTGQSLREKLAGSQASLLLALSVLIVFL